MINYCIFGLGSFKLATYAKIFYLIYINKRPLILPINHKFKINFHFGIKNFDILVKKTQFF